MPSLVIWGGITFLLIFLLPIKGWLAIGILAFWLLALAAVVWLSAKLITGSYPSISSSIKATLFSLVISIAAAIFGFKLLSVLPIVVAMMMVVIAVFCFQSIAFSMSLNLNTREGMLMSVVVNVLTSAFSFVIKNIFTFGVRVFS